MTGQEPLRTLRARLAVAACRAHGEDGLAGEYVGQENFMTASEMLSLALEAGVGPGSRVLDLCCGRGGPALHLAQRTGCLLVGVDLSPEAVLLAREAAALCGLASKVDFLVADVLHLPFSETSGEPFDAALLFETMRAFEDKGALLRELRRLLRPGGRLGMTLEEGCPLSTRERSCLPDGEEARLTPEDEFLTLLGRAGFRVRVNEDHTASHARVARRLAEALREGREAFSAMGAEAYEELLASHERWAKWLGNGRVRKLAIVADPVPGAGGQQRHADRG